MKTSLNREDNIEEKVMREVYATDGNYIILHINEDDRENYVELHRQVNGEETLFLNPVCKDIMWEHVLEGKDKVFSIFDGEGDYFGSMEIQNPDSNTPELGIDLLENKRNKGIAVKAIKLLAKRFYEDKKVDYFLIRISSKNSHSRHVFEKMGVIPIGIEESAFKTFMRDFKEVVGDDISEVQDILKKYIDGNEHEEEEIIYRYKLIPELFL